MSYYLDSAATTYIYPEVLDAMLPFLTEYYYNPSSSYSVAKICRNAVENARGIIAQIIGSLPEEIYFCSGATEANNWVIKRTFATEILTTNIEHSSVLSACIGTHKDVKYIPINKYGIIQTEKVNRLDKVNRLVSVMYVNNEVGSIQPIDELVSVTDRKYDFVHTDATQAMGKMPINVKKLGVDSLSASGHKFHAPKGIGFLYVSSKKQNRIHALIRGGEQERGARPGTENVAGIVGLAKALELCNERMTENTIKVARLRNHMYGRITNEIPTAHINGTADWKKRIASNLNFRFDDVRGEELLAFLDDSDIYVSTGSACHSASKSPSHVLKAIGLNDDEADSSIRLTLDESLTISDIDFVVDVLKDGVNLLTRG